MKKTLITLLAMGLFAATADAATIYQSGSDVIAFEAEIGDIDNSFNLPGLGWAVDGATTPPAGSSGGSYVVNNENSGSTAPRNTLTYNIDFDKTGSYDVWFRLAYTTDDFEDDRDDRGNNDSFYYEDQTIGDASVTWSTMNAGTIDDSISTTSWIWFNRTASVNGTNTVNVGSTGALDWTVSNREDGLMIDRIVLVHPDLTDTVDDAFLNGLPNNPIPEPATLALAAVGLLGLRRRRRA